MMKPAQMSALFCMLALTLPGVSAVCDTEYSALLGAQQIYQGCVSAACDVRPRNCVDIQAQGYTTSGVYAVFYLAGSVETPVSVYCDMDTEGGGWLVFQRRQDGSEDFYRNWADYANGFGDLNGEFWLGNRHIHKLASSALNTLRVDLGDFDGQKRYAEYTSFTVGDEANKFPLHIQTYSGDAGNSLSHHNGKKFSTKDQDNDIYSPGACAVIFKGAWWYGKCHDSNLNGRYLSGPYSSYGDGVLWQDWRGNNYSLKFTEMKMRPQ